MCVEVKISVLRFFTLAFPLQSRIFSLILRTILLKIIQLNIKLL